MLCAIACAFRWGATLVGKIQLLGIAHLVVGKKFQVLEVRWRMKLIRDLNGEGKARFEVVVVVIVFFFFFFYLVKI